MTGITVMLAALLIAQGAGQATTIRADGPPAWGTNVRLTLERTVGTLDGPPEYALNSVGYLAGTLSGAFYLYDHRDHQIRFYDAGGKFVRPIGRKGSGPGEYQQLMGMGLIGDSSLVTWDAGLLRLTYFKPDGTPLSSVTPRLSSSMFGSNLFGVDRSGIASIMVASPSKQDTSFYIRMRRDGSILDSVRFYSGSEMAFSLSTPEGSRVNFATQSLGRPYPWGGLVTAVTTTLGFTIRQGTRALTVTRRFTPLPVQSGEKADYQGFAKMFNGRKDVQAEGLIAIPDMKPALRDLQLDRDGRVWLDIYTVAEQQSASTTRTRSTGPRLTWRERTTFEVFSAVGTYLGKVALPLGHEFADARGDRVWTVTKGPDDEIQIAIFRIEHR
ncbi:MAG: hypothetical protein IPP98_07765 [Gemmatimonadetes bacterium]|nr:hypothetical protein [Gemmatimonadota bacterium]